MSGNAPPKVVVGLAYQLREDLGYLDFVPNLKDDDVEYIPDRKEHEYVVLGPSLGRGLQSRVFEIQQRSEVIKYQADCFTVGHVHPLMRDYWMLRELASTGLVPTVHFLSPPVPLSFGSVKTDFGLPEMGRTQCLEMTRKPNLRYMVLDQVGHSLFRVIEQAVNYEEDVVPVAAFQTLKVIIDGLRTIHENGIVHGDIHPGNLVVTGGGISSSSISDRLGSRTSWRS